MILPIYTYGQPVLRKEAQDITPDYPELKTLIANMYETLAASEGIGLAAPQIGLDIRLVVSQDIQQVRQIFVQHHIVALIAAAQASRISSTPAPLRRRSLPTTAIT